jgi:hypothetical protein
MDETPLYRLFDKGSELLEKEMDLVKIIRSLRKLKIISKKAQTDMQVKYLILQSDKNVINLDSDEEESESSESSRAQNIV